MRRVAVNSSRPDNNVHDHLSTNNGERKKVGKNFNPIGTHWIIIQLTFLVVALILLSQIWFIWDRHDRGSDVSDLAALENIPVDDTCLDITPIRPIGLFFSDPGIHNAASPREVTPQFLIGSLFRPGQVVKHMSGDITYYNLIREHQETKESRNSNGLTFDIGANQGFYTYYLATLGFEVHAFEIDRQNFNALQHGLLFNPAPVSRRVNLYPMGLSDTTGRFENKGFQYGSYLEVAQPATPNSKGKKNQQQGSILSTTFDCFIHHAVPLPLPHISFVKIDVEGFEIAVLRGARNTLLHPSTTIGALLIEIGPTRWSRASTSIEDGIAEMKRLSKKFRYAFLNVRPGYGHLSHCSPDLALNVSDVKPRSVDTLRMHKVEEGEWDGLLVEMERKGSDCNFWFSND